MLFTQNKSVAGSRVTRQEGLTPQRAVNRLPARNVLASASAVTTYSPEQVCIVGGLRAPIQPNGRCGGARFDLSSYNG